MDVGMMMVFASYGSEDCSDARVWDEKSGWLGSRLISALTVCGRRSTTSTTTRSCPTTSN
jgi:hypothetical protein